LLRILPTGFSTVGEVSSAKYMPRQNRAWTGQKLCDLPYIWLGSRVMAMFKLRIPDFSVCQSSASHVEQRKTNASFMFRMPGAPSCSSGSVF
jgi:hypothetical protein